MEKLISEGRVIVLGKDNNLNQHYLSKIRSESTRTGEFVHCADRLGNSVFCEAMKTYPSKTQRIKTPLQEYEGSVLDSTPVIIDIMRGGAGISKSARESIPEISICHIGLSRDPVTLMPYEYLKLKKVENMKNRNFLLVDPMIATGNSGSYVLKILAEMGINNVKYLSIISCEQGIKRILNEFPSVIIYTISVDGGLNDKGYIFDPGLGDFGDRYFGTVSDHIGVIIQ